MYGHSSSDVHRSSSHTSKIVDAQEGTRSRVVGLTSLSRNSGGAGREPDDNAQRGGVGKHDRVSDIIDGIPNVRPGMGMAVPVD